MVIRDAELSGSVRPQTIYFEATEALKTETGISVSPSGYMIKKPYYRAVSSASPLMEYTAFSGLTAEDIAAVYPTAVQLREYGFGDPYSACTFNLAVQRTNTETDENGEEVYTFSYYNVFKYTVKLGNENEDGLRYAVVYAEDELFPVVYLVDESGIEWADAQYDDMADTLLFYIHIVSVERMTLTLDGTTTTFELTHTPSEDGTSTDLAVTAGGTAYDDDEFRDVYTGLMGMYRTGKADGVPAGSPVLTVSIESNTASVQDVQIKLYQQSASKYTVVQSTGEIYSVNAKTVEAFLDQYRAFLGDMVEEF